MLRSNLPKRPQAAASARRLIDRIDAPLDDDARATAYLLVTELVANAVRHVEAEGDVRVEVSHDGERLRVTIVDPGTGFEYRPRTQDAPLASGWGLHLVDALSDRWGMRGNRVWFELAPGSVTRPL